MMLRHLSKLHTVGLRQLHLSACCKIPRGSTSRSFPRGEEHKPPVRILPEFEEDSTFMIEPIPEPSYMPTTGGVKAQEKWGYLLINTQSGEQAREKVYLSNFGKVRLDDDNVPLVDGQFEGIESENDAEDEPSFGANYGMEVMPEGEAALEGDESEQDQMSLFEQSMNETPPEKKTEMNYFDDAVFGESYKNYISNSPDLPNVSNAPNDTDHSSSKQQPDSDLNFFDEQAYGDSYRKYVQQSKETSNMKQAEQEISKPSDMNYFDEITYGESYRQYLSTSSANSVVPETPVSTELRDSAPVYADTTVGDMKQSQKPKPNLETPVTAYDYVMKMRREQHEYQATLQTGSANPASANEGHITYRKMVTNCCDIPSDQLQHILKNNILYDNYDIVALYKMYGISIHETSTLSHHKLADYLPALADYCKTQQLFPVHRLDKETTGVLLFAKTEKMAAVLKSYFRKHKIHKTYLAITKSVPSPREGIIDIPIRESHVEDKIRMSLSPNFRDAGFYNSKNASRFASNAVTHYKTISTTDSAALVELKPLTGVKHQLRVHLALGLNCPVLGDHKYSHLTKMAPQKLPGDILNRIKMRQGKVRDVPMHLHAAQVILPGLADGRDIWISARLPGHFAKSMKWLKLSAD